MMSDVVPGAGRYFLAPGTMHTHIHDVATSLIIMKYS